MKKVALFLILMPALLLSGNVEEEAKQVGLDLLSAHRDNFNETIIEPVTTGTNLHSVDQQQDFTAQLTCTDNDRTEKFITVRYTGISNITINVNADFMLDGTNDKAWSFYNVSGVCANGIVKCDGEFSEDACTYYLWQYNTAAEQLETVEVDRNMVNNCYCTDDECENTSTTKQEEILTALLTPIATTIANNNPQYVLTQTDVTNAEAIGYAQSTNGCENGYAGSQVGNDYGQIQADINTEVGYQQNQENSAYSFMQEQQPGTAREQVKDEAELYATTQADYDLQLQQNQELDPVNMKVEAYGDGSFTDSATLQGLGIVDENRTYCKVKVWETETTLFNDSEVRTETNNDTQKYHIDIRECENNACIYDNANEEMLEDCDPDTNGFAEAVSTLTAVNEASKDMVCSTN